jgi:hypothetical protein
MARLEDCLVDAWAKLNKYRKSLMVEHESEQMQQFHVIVNNRWKHGQIGDSHNMPLKIDFHSWFIRLLIALTSHFSLSLVLMWRLD